MLTELVGLWAAPLAFLQKAVARTYAHEDGGTPSSKPCAALRPRKCLALVGVRECASRPTDATKGDTLEPADTRSWRHPHADGRATKSHA